MHFLEHQQRIDGTDRGTRIAVPGWGTRFPGHQMIRELTRPAGTRFARAPGRRRTDGRILGDLHVWAVNRSSYPICIKLTRVWLKSG